MIVNLSDQNSLVYKYLNQLRDQDIQQDSMRFRINLERLGNIFAYEISKTFDYSKFQVETPLGVAKSLKYDDHVILGTILRAGLPLHNGLLSFFDDAASAFISAYRKHHKGGSFDIKAGYITCPDLDDRTLILSDPMIATGASMNVVLKALSDYGEPKSIHVVTAIASTEGLNYLRRKHPEVQIWVGDIDEELTAKAYIVPGLGDAGDLSFGAKIQE
jgi:uracil phosphoribosyltransferase